MPNKRIRKKHRLCCWAPIHCRCEIANHIVRKCEEAGIKWKHNAIWSYTHWFYIHSSYDEWLYRVSASYDPKQMYLSAKHLLTQIYHPAEEEC